MRQGLQPFPLSEFSLPFECLLYRLAIEQKVRWIKPEKIQASQGGTLKTLGEFGVTVPITAPYSFSFTLLTGVKVTPSSTS